MSGGPADVDVPPPDDESGYPELPEHLRRDVDDPRAQSRSQARLIVLLMFGAIPMLVVLFIVLMSLAHGPPGPQRAAASGELDRVTRYCTYTARDDASYRLCLNKTDSRIVDRAHTNAGRYARGELMRCLPDAGYRCVLR